MNSRFFLAVIFSLITTVFTIGCSEEEEVVKVAKVAKVMTATPVAQNVSNATGIFDITITGNTDWTAVSSASWCTISPVTGSGNGAVAVNYQDNSEASTRTATITISGTDVTPVSITVTQDKGSDLPPNQTNTEKLCDNGSWKCTAMTCDPAYNWPNDNTSDGQTDWYQYYMAECEKDNLIKFNSNGDYVWEEGSDDCGGSSSELWEQFIVINNGNWNFNIAETNITIEGVEYEIISLSATELKYKYTMTVSGTNLAITITLSH